MKLTVSTSCVALLFEPCGINVAKVKKNAQNPRDGGIEAIAKLGRRAAATFESGNAEEAVRGIMMNSRM